MLQGLLPHQQKPYELQPRTAICYLECSGDANSKLRVVSESSGVGVSLNILQIIGSVRPAVLESTYARYESSTASDTTFEIAKMWLDTCISEHTSCSASSRKDWLPSRIVDVGSDAHPPKLFINRGFNYNKRYVTLSHCWGTTPTLKLTTSWISTFEKEIPMISLPPTFRDAISATRRLGFQYIWIDSLCICQDSRDDWAKESALMGDIYLNAVLNISATASPNSQGGLFFSRDERALRPCKIKTPSPSSEKGVLADCTFYIYRNSDVWKAITDSPISKRGWVLQERVLSPRILHFGREQTFWECRQHEASEMYPEGLKFWSILPSPDQNLKMIIQKPTLVNRPWASEFPASTFNQQQIRYADWAFIVETYSKAALTKQSDKFVALFALTKVWGRFLDDECFAGLWKKDILRQLLWHFELLREDERKVIRRLGMDRDSQANSFPSWSWAYVDGPVSHCVINYHEDTAQTRLLANVTLFKAFDKSSKHVISEPWPRLIIRGPARRCNVYKDEFGIHHLVQPSKPRNFSLHHYHLERWDWQNTCYVDLKLRTLEFFCLTIAKVDAHENSANTLPIVYALMFEDGTEVMSVEELSFAGQGYRRVGIVEVIGEEKCQWFEEGEVQEVTIR